PSYRAFAQDWTGHPSEPPAAAARFRTGGATVFASWDGATEGRSWGVFAGRTAGGLDQITTARQNGVATGLEMSKRGPYLAVQARDAKGHALARSRPVKIR